MRVIFMGTPDFAVPTLDALVEAGHEIVLVVAQPDRKSGRGQRLRSPPVAERAKVLGLPLSQPRAIRSGSFPKRVLGLNADVAVVLAYGRILTPELLNAPKWGCVNVHASLLPRWRGAAPIQASILAGDTVSGVCTQRMEEGLDTGPLYLSETLSLESDETAGSLHDKLMHLSASVAVETLAGLEETVPMPQSEEGICWAPKISKSDGEVNWGMSAKEIHRRVRAMSPWPSGWIHMEQGPLKLLSVSMREGSGAPGVVLSVSPELIVACGEGAIGLDRVQAPGRKPVSGRDFANGARLAPNQEW